MKVIQILGKECNNIWCRDMRIRGEKGIRKDHDGFLRWTYNLDFCTPRYIVRRELGIEKLKIRWGIRARRYAEKIKGMEEERWVKICWEEKRNGNRKDIYSKEKERYYNRNG